jgi:hypothetical protein
MSVVGKRRSENVLESLVVTVLAVGAIWTMGAAEAANGATVNTVTKMRDTMVSQAMALVHTRFNLTCAT